MADTILHLGERAYSGPSEAPPRECLDSCDDLRLLEGLREGDEEAYETLVARFQQPVYNLVCRLLSKPQMPATWCKKYS